MYQFGFVIYFRFKILIMSEVRFFYKEVNPVINNRKVLQTFIAGLFKKEKKRLSKLNYVFCTDEALLQINKAYLNHNYYTDIITFDLSDGPNELVGEIYISIDRVRENAKQLGNSLKEEVHRVVFHGALHLVGYGDKTPNQIKTMRAKEDAYLKLYFKKVSRGT